MSKPHPQGDPLDMIFEEWIDKARSLGASDLHLETNTPAVARIRGELQPVSGAVSAERLVQAGRSLLGAEGWAQFKARGSADIAVSVRGVRCRASFFLTVRGIAIAIRLLAPSVKDIRACNLHADFRRFTEATTGLVIISGPTGSGKSTTLAALIEEINASRARHIVTLESPLEYVFANRLSYIRQREIPTHSPSFEQGITDALRENPDVLVISEMRTPEVMRLTLNAAETGHLVLATMHSANCAEAVSRLCMSFPADLQASVRAQLADCLVGVSCQRLDFLGAHRLLVPRCEILLPSSGAKGTIRAGNFSQIANVLQASGDEGMWTFDRYRRWMDQVGDWVRPTAAAAAYNSAEYRLPAEHGRSVEPRAAPDHRLSAEHRHSLEVSDYGAAAPLTAVRSAGQAKPSPARAAPADDVIEVPAEEMDLAQLAELAKKIVERKPS
jgi:twitching motility protein PilT